MVGSASKTTVCKSKWLPDETIKPISTSNNSLNPGKNYFDNTRTGIKFS